jgi:hypothetical protein
MESMVGIKAYEQESAFWRWWKTRTFLQKRMIRFCISMSVAIGCIPLHRLGLFGSVDGPLNPSRIGESLAGMGVTKTHSMVFFLSFLIISLCWNWIFNIVSHLMGSRLTCNKVDEEGKACGAPTVRRKVVQKKTGSVVSQYVCSAGHKRPEAHFHPLQKGTASHTVSVIAFAFCVIVLFLS